MFRIIPIVFVFLAVSLTANAQIYLRKDTQPIVPKAAPQNQKMVPSENVPREAVPSRNALNNAKSVANACLDNNWKTQPCLKAVSENNLLMASNYAATLSENGKEADAENIKQGCAASTAATKNAYPAEAMRSAYVECVNTIARVSEASGMTPDQSQFQLLFSAVQCLDKTLSCTQIERGLAAYK